MNVTDRIKHDHLLIRSQVKALGSMIAMLPETRAVLREACVMMCKRLHEHCQRETEALARYQEPFGGRLSTSPVLQHHERLQSLEILSQCFLEERPFLLERGVRRLLVAVLQGLDGEMEMQESMLFPRIEDMIETTEEGGSTEIDPAVGDVTWLHGVDAEALLVR